MDDRHAETSAGLVENPDPQRARPLMVLHVGMHKTGSTAMQVFLSDRAEQLRTAGYVYPVAGRHGDQHSVLPATFFPGHAFLPDAVRQTPREEVLAGIAAEVGPGQSALLSSEVFWELLTYRPDEFDDLCARLAEDWTVVLLYFARDPHSKSWSSVKHLGRLGRLADPVGAYREDRRLAAAAEARLREAHPDAVRVEYDGRDSVGQLIEFLSSQVLAGAARSTPAQLAALEVLRGGRRPKSRRRVNSDVRNPYGPAVVLCVAPHLGPVDPDDFRFAMLPRLYARLFRTRDGGWADLGLPSDQELGERVRQLADSDDAELFSEAERRAVLAGLSSRGVRWRARAARCTSSLTLATDAVRRSLDSA